jgi:hypothetical protein
MQPDPFERLRSALEEASWSHDFLAEYVTQLSPNGAEEDIFRRLAFRCVDADAGALILSDFSDLYEAMSLEDKAELRRCWHEKIHREAYHYDDLRERLSWRYRV